MKTIALKTPIDQGDDAPITSVILKEPKLKTIQGLSLVFGADLLNTLIDASRERAKDTGKSKSKQATDDFDLRPILSAVMSENCYHRFNSWLAAYLAIDLKAVEKLGLLDLLEIGKGIYGFFSEMGELLEAILPDTSSTQKPS